MTSPFSRPSGTPERLICIADPAINRWAIINRPSGTNNPQLHRARHRRKRPINETHEIGNEGMGARKANRWVICVIVMVLCGCAFAPPVVDRSRAAIDDVSVPGGVKYEIVAVDGKPVERWRHPVHTVIPYVIVEPGTHTLSLQPRPGEDRMPATVVGSFEAGKRYRLELDGQEPNIIEDAE